MHKIPDATSTRKCDTDLRGPEMFEITEKSIYYYRYQYCCYFV